MGRIPLRQHIQYGYEIQDGSKQENDWIGLIPFEDQAKIINPAKGYIITANNKFAANSIKHRTSLNTATTPRADRIDEMIN